MEFAPTTGCQSRLNIKPLPRRPAPVRDELLSSWVARLATANHCSSEELCGYFGLEQGRAPEQANDLTRVNLDLMGSAVQRTRDELAAMTLPEMAHLPIPCVAQNDFQHCIECTKQTPDLVLGHWRFAWSMDCEKCGQALTAMHSIGGVPDKLRARAARGADILKSAVANSDVRLLRRIDLAMHLMNELDLGPLAFLTSRTEHARLMALAVVGTCTSRPMMKAAIVLRGNTPAIYRLRRTFPHHRRVVDKISGLSRALDERFPRRPQGDCRPKREWNGKTTVKASESALAAARQAISELGSSADSQTLLARADAIWRGHRKSDIHQAQPVDIL